MPCQSCDSIFPVYGGIINRCAIYFNSLLRGTRLSVPHPSLNNVSLPGSHSPTASAQLLSIDCASGLRTSGERIAGSVICALPMDEVTAISIVLRGEITALDHTTIDAPMRYDRQDFALPVRTILDAERHLWPTSKPTPAASLGSLPSTSTDKTTTAFNFSFRLPLDTNMPPSYQFSNSTAEASVRFYLQARLSRKGWYRRTLKVNHVFPFIPAVRPELSESSDSPDWRLLCGATSSPAPVVSWLGNWKTYEKTQVLKKGISSSTKGSCVVRLLLPSVNAIPLFTAIPLRICIIIKSNRINADSSASPPTPPPRLPTPNIEDIDLNLIQHCRMCVFVAARDFDHSLGSQAGFGSGKRHPQTRIGVSSPSATVRMERGEPEWALLSAGQGEWVQEVTYESSIILQCAPPFETSSLSSSLSLDLNIRFPNTKSTARLSTGPLTITSGLAVRGATSATDVPPPFADYELDLPPSYFALQSQEDDT